QRRSPGSDKERSLDREAQEEQEADPDRRDEPDLRGGNRARAEGPGGLGGENPGQDTRSMRLSSSACRLCWSLSVTARSTASLRRALTRPNSPAKAARQIHA